MGCARASRTAARAIAAIGLLLGAGWWTAAGQTTTTTTPTAPPPFPVLSTTKVGPAPLRVTYGYGAAWTLNGNGTVSRVDATTGAVRTTSIGPNPRDIRAGYNAIWVLRSTTTTATLIRLNTGTGAKVGSAVNIKLGSTVDGSTGNFTTGANTLSLGSNLVWVAGVGTWNKLATVSPTTSAVVVRSWPIPSAFTVASGAVWSVTPNQQSLQRRSVSNLAILGSFPVASATGGVAGRMWLTYGAGYLWLSQSTPNDLGQIDKISLTTGLVPGAASRTLDIGLSCTTVGLGAVWAVQAFDGLSGMQGALIALSQVNLAEIAREPLPPGATAASLLCVVAGGDFVWATDGMGNLYKVAPPATG